jgi:hypothetical protein
VTGVQTCALPIFFSKPLKWKKAVIKLKEGQTIDLFPKE